MRRRVNNVLALCYVCLALFLFVQIQKHTSFRSEQMPLLLLGSPLNWSAKIHLENVEIIAEECACRSQKSEKIHDFCYKLPEISSIRKLGFHNTIVLYSLGIKEKRLEELKETACNLEIRNFNFSKYPGYVAHLKDYRWKPIVIAETLRDFGAIWYLDSSVIFEKLNVSHVYDLIKCHGSVHESSVRDVRESREKHEDGWNREIWERNLRECRKGQYLLHGYSGHGILSVTNPGVYTYFPTNPHELSKKKAKMYDAGFVFAVNTRQTMSDIVKWYFLCALQEDCMAPKGASLGCSFRGDDRFTEYADCHRFDQSIINLVLANQFWYDRRYYVSEIVDFFHIDRGGSSGHFDKDLQCI
ncbi:unnamed protein product [Caenorhabditis sp. 36 PRJEB53466]|nr:unnamed protein product [Caenorhabditis sp. 36 PRJEB53466]